MARPLRIEYPGALYHITSRGNGGADIYRDDGDRQLFLDVLGTVCRRLQGVCYAYCLMSNHYYLVLETPEGNLSKGMRHLNGVYTQRFNRRHSRSGHVFQGRYKAVLIDRDAYLLEVARYVVLNPVRAGMVSHPASWPGCSYGATVGTVQAPDWLGTGVLLHHFGRGLAQARSRYAQFVHDGYNRTRIWSALQRQIYLGDERFVVQMQSRLTDGDTLNEVPKVQRQRNPQPLVEIEAEHGNRGAAMAAAYGTRC